MFTGLVQTIGKVHSLEDHVLNITLPFLELSSGLELPKAFLTPIELGESIAVNGVCLTVESFEMGHLQFHLGPETLERTQLRILKPGDLVHLERSLCAQDRLGGHFVYGHVDGLARITSITPVAESHACTFEIPNELIKYCVEKGSIALDGVSLTINHVDDSQVQVVLVPHTWNYTRFSTLSVGQCVHVEVDMIAKYVERLCQKLNQ